MPKVSVFKCVGMNDTVALHRNYKKKLLMG